MPPETSIWRAMNLKTDFLRATPLYLDLIRNWTTYPALVSEQSLRRVLYRYETMWLPLVSEWFQTDLQPPTDVYWVWHVHMLHPKLYVDYCMAKYGRILPHKIRLTAIEEKHAHERTKLIWKDKYPTETFDLDLRSINPGTYQTNGTKLTPLIRNAAKVMQFAHQVSLPHFRDANFINAAVDRYRRFLSLMKLRPHARIAPPVDILLAWRLHALHPVEYHNEAFRPLHLYSLSEHVQHDGRCLLDYGYNDSDWNAIYRDPLLVPGSAFRGAHDYSVMYTLPADEPYSRTMDKCDIVLDNILISEVWSRDKKLVLIVRLLGQSSFSGSEILRLETTVGKTNTAMKAMQDHGLVKFSFDSKENRGVEFNIFAVRGVCSCTRGETNLSTTLFNPREPFGEASFTTRDFLYEIPKVSHVDPKISFQCRLRAAPPQPHILSLDRKPLKARPLPKDLIPFVRDLPKWRDGIARESPGENGLEFLSACHSLKDRERESLEFNVEVIKQNDLDLGAVLVRRRDNKLLVTAHVVGEETLASPQQLTRKCPTHLDVDEEELAMLVSNHAGEWAVCKSRWEAENDEGRIKFTVFFLQSHKDLTFYIRDDEMQTIRFGDVTIDMPTGRVTVDSRSPDIAENVALAFSVGILYVSCQVRATVLMASRSTKDLTGSVRSSKSFDFEASASSNKTPTTPKFTVRRRNKKHARKRKMSASFTYLLATGLQIDVALHGSTGRNQKPVARASLASIHLLYERSVSNDSNLSPDQSTNPDTRNNNDTSYTYNGSIASAPDTQPPSRPDRHPTGLYRQNWENSQNSANGLHKKVNGQSFPTYIINNQTSTQEANHSGDVDNSMEYEYMDIRL